MRLSQSPPAAAAAQASLRSLAVVPGGNDRWPQGSFVGMLPNAARGAALRAGTLVRFGDAEFLVRQGEAGDFLYVLVGGKVKVLVAAEATGTETMLAIRSRGDLIGEFALLDEKPRTAAVRAIGTVTARKVSRADFNGFSADHPVVRDVVTRYLLGKIRASTARHAAERQWDARARLVQVLYELAVEHGATGSDGLVLVPITQAELGQMAGLAVSTTERVLKELRKLGIVATKYRVMEIRDMDSLKTMRFPEEDDEGEEA